MSLLGKIKNVLFKKTIDGTNKLGIGKIFGLSALLIGNIGTIAAISIAWFSLASSGNSQLSMVTGDLDVNIKKVTAYKYIYPFYPGSSEFINYNAKANECKVQSYVLEDHDLMFEEEKVDTILSGSVSNIATVNINESTTPGYINHLGGSSTYSQTDLEVPSGSRFRYYLVGDGVFSGDGTSWRLDNSSAIPFPFASEVAADKPAVLENVVISAGASFIVFNANSIGKVEGVETTCRYYTYSNIIQANSAFRITNNNRIVCLQSNVYKITFKPDSLTIEKQNRRDAIISNNSLDPTQISIDYVGGKVDKNEYGSIDSYMPDAIFGQNTTVILDVELAYSNINRVQAGLTIERRAAESKSMFNKQGKYTNYTYDLVGYSDSSHINELNASDFYCYYAQFTSTAYANNNAVWAALHKKTNVVGFTKFDNISRFDTTIPCTLNTINDETLIIEPNTATTFHCYVAIDYDYIFTKYFMYEKRLGKTYYLYRDFTFHFTATQVLEEAN